MLGPESLSQKSNIQKNLRKSQLEAYLKKHVTPRRRKMIMSMMF